MLPSAMTVAAICFGLSAVKMALDGRATEAMAFLAAAAILDALDGRAARMLNATSKMGEEIDSLADAVNFGVAPAGVRKDNTGHHHLLVDADLPPMDEPIPNDKNHIHFGKGQTETFLELPPGKHTLQLLMGDSEHIPHDPPIMSKKITITVRPGGDNTRVSAR